MNDLAEYRLKNSKSRLEASKMLLEQGFYKDSINRSYYAIFDAMRAVLAEEGVDYKKHAGVIAHFQKEYIKTRKFDVKYSAYIQKAFQIRNDCDYNDFYIVSQEEAGEQYNNAMDFYLAVCEYSSTES